MGELLVIVGIMAILGAFILRFVHKAVERKNPVINNKIFAVLLIGGLISMTINGSFFYAEAGHQYMVQYPWGTQVSVMKPGYNLKLWGDVLPFKKIITVRLTEDVDAESETASAEDNSALVRFNDAVRAKVSFSTCFRLPTSDEEFLTVAIDFRTEYNLIGC